MKNVFDEKLDESASKIFDLNKGQSFYVEKYNKVWLGKRPRPQNQEVSKGRKRVKFSNFELCLDANPHLQPHALQRSQENIGANIFLKHLRKMRNFDLKPVATEAGVSQRFLQEKQLAMQDQRSVVEGSGEGSQLFGEEDESSLAL